MCRSVSRRLSPVVVHVVVLDVISDVVSAVVFKEAGALLRDITPQYKGSSHNKLSGLIYCGTAP